MALVLQAVGTGAVAALGYAAYNLSSALLGSADTATLAADLPPDAFANKVVWITGASSGIGKEIAIQLAKQNARLILSSRRGNALEEVAREMRATNHGLEVEVLPLDLADLDSLPGKAAEALRLFGGRIDVLVNNGGVSTRSTAAESSLEVDLWVTKVDFLSYVVLTKSVLPAMREHGGGTLINISSIAGKVGVGLRTAYCGAKHAILGWFDALRVEEFAADSNISVCNVCPGSVQTDVAKNAVTTSLDKAFGQNDVNIASGLPVAWTCERILAAAHCKVDEVWIGKMRELGLVYLSHYMPARSKTLIKGMARGLMEETKAGVAQAKSRL